MKQNIRVSVSRSHCKRHRACHPLLEEDNGCSFAMTVLDLGQVLFSHGSDRLHAATGNLKPTQFGSKRVISCCCQSLREDTDFIYSFVYIASQRLGIQRLRELPMLVGSHSLKIFSQLKIHRKHARCTALLESDL